MIKITNKVYKTQKNFWSNCLFHPTDAVEDPWGKRILDQMAKDKAIETVRIYTMFEDIVYMDENEELQYDFRLSDLRLDYLLEKGYDLLLAYGGMPDCISSNEYLNNNVAKNKTRYKGKMWNTSPPKDVKLWEEICYEYTKHIVERYGIERVSKWHCQCFNEPDISAFFMRGLTGDSPRRIYEKRAIEYFAMYKAFVKGIRRVSDKILVGGPALAGHTEFLEKLLNSIKEENIGMDFISFHCYGTSPKELNAGLKEICVENVLEKYREKMEVVNRCGFGDKPILVDEWGAVSHGFFNREECPQLMYRETEEYSAFYTRLIYDIVHSEMNIEKMIICLSGQHEMVEDFSGFNNFFTLNFIKKPIYNAYILAKKLHEEFLETEQTTENLYVLPTRNGQGEYSVLLTYASENFTETIESVEEEIEFEEDLKGKCLTIYCIDKTTTNPYRLFQTFGVEQPNEEQIKLLREEGKLKPMLQEKYSGKIKLTLTPNCTYLITIGETL